MRRFKWWMKDKKWLAFGSGVGGALGALIMRMNEFFSTGMTNSFDMPMGIGLTIALGMFGGMIGGAIGSFISGIIFKEDTVTNIGEALGVGLINGFAVGTIVGILIGYLHQLNPTFITPVTLSIIMAAVIILAGIVYYGALKPRDLK